MHIHHGSVIGNLFYQAVWQFGSSTSMDSPNSPTGDLQEPNADSMMYSRTIFYSSIFPLSLIKVELIKEDIVGLEFAG